MDGAILKLAAWLADHTIPNRYNKKYKTEFA